MIDRNIRDMFYDKQECGFSFVVNVPPRAQCPDESPKARADVQVNSSYVSAHFTMSMISDTSSDSYLNEHTCVWDAPRQRLLVGRLL